MLLSQQTSKMLDRFVERPTHALLLLGEHGSGTQVAVTYLINKLRVFSDDKQIVTTIEPDEKGLISIETVRILRSSLKHKNAASGVSRISVVYSVEAMQGEAQNALLKILEEPPVGTLLIMTSEKQGSILPTVQSRCVVVPVLPVTKDQAIAYYAPLDAKTISTFYAISTGLVGVLDILVATGDDTNESIELAKSILKMSLFERLALIDSQLKKRDVALACIVGLQRVIHATMQKHPEKQQWQKYMHVVLQAKQKIQANVQAKLVLTEMFIQLGS